MGSRRRGSASSTLPGKRKMEIHLALMMLLATGVLAQDDDAAAQPVCDKDCEESWQYVEFLKNDINGNITEILTNFKTTQDGDKAVTKTMEKVMEVRESIHTFLKTGLVFTNDTFCAFATILRKTKTAKNQVFLCSSVAQSSIIINFCTFNIRKPVLRT